MYRARAKHEEQPELRQGDCDVGAQHTLLHLHWKPLCYKCRGSRKHDACEAVENGGGVGKAGNAGEWDWSEERTRGGRRGRAWASFAMVEESTVWGDWLRESAASLPVRGSSEDAPLNWEGVHSLGVCTESSAITSCTLRTGTPRQNRFPHPALIDSSALSAAAMNYLRRRLSDSTFISNLPNGYMTDLQRPDQPQPPPPASPTPAKSPTTGPTPPATSPAPEKKPQPAQTTGAGFFSSITNVVKQTAASAGLVEQTQVTTPKKFKILLVIDEPQQEW